MAALLLEADASWLQVVTASWQKGALSTLDYLLYLNLASGRSFNDLTQWPVMPWVLSDYHSQTLNLDDKNSFRDLSKPVSGAFSKISKGNERKRKEIETKMKQK
jgi:factor associated with neutral sphingomyelinase activation